MTRNRTLLVLALVLLACITLNAQVTGTVTGTILDSSGAAIPGAAVRLQLPGTGQAAFATKTTAAGAFSIPAVPANTYDLVIEADGFLKSIRKGIEVLPGRAYDVPDVKLDIAGVSQSVEVTESGTHVQTSDAEISTTIAKTQIANLPVADRSPLAFL